MARADLVTACLPSSMRYSPSSLFSGRRWKTGITLCACVARSSATALMWGALATSRYGRSLSLDLQRRRQIRGRLSYLQAIWSSTVEILQSRWPPWDTPGLPRKPRKCARIQRKRQLLDWFRLLCLANPCQRGDVVKFLRACYVC